MTQHDGMTIHKFPFQTDGGLTEIDLPAASKVLSIQVDQATGWPAAWVELNPSHPASKKLVLQIVTTGGEVPLGEYHSTFQTVDSVIAGNFVGHVYGSWA